MTHHDARATTSGRTTIPVARHATDVSSWRSNAVMLGIVAGWMLLGARLVQLQWVDRFAFAERATRQQSHVETISARPGEIVDRHGHVLATTVTAPSLYVDPSQIDTPWDTAWLLAECLELDGHELFDRFTKHRDRQFLWIQRRLTEEDADNVRALDLPEKCWGLRDEYLRQYPQGVLAAHVLGTRDIDGVGHGGLEQSLDDVIRGTPGSRSLIRDARGTVIEVDEHLSVPPQHGRTAVLTVDSIIQVYVERGLDDIVETWQPAGACAIVMNPENGEIHAMASRPVFDPNDPSGVPENAWTNLCVSAMYEPGSTVKPLIVGRALQTGVITPTEQFDCGQGEWKMGTRVLHDHHGYGRLDVADILVKSSNIGMAQIGSRMTNVGLFEAVSMFGFGRRTGIEIPGEISGAIRPLEDWDDYSTGSVPMGQEIAATPLQIITAHAALANGGRLIRPHLVSSSNPFSAAPLTRLETDAEPARVVSQTIPADIARWLIEGPLRDVVRRGTARHIAFDDAPMFGKTGTAQKFDPETGTYADDRYVCSFVCGAPAQRPQAIVLVVVDSPTLGTDHFGGSVAAPAAATILRHALLRMGTRDMTADARQ